MQTSSDYSLRVARVNQELDLIFNAFQKDLSTILATLTINDRIYRVCRVIQIDEKTIISKLISDAVFKCDKCPEESSIQKGDWWLTITYKDHEQKVSAQAKHVFNSHPSHVPEEHLKAFEKLFFQ